MAECIVESCAVISSVFSRILVDKLRQSREPIRKQKKRRFWVRKWILERDAEVHRLIDRELRCSHPEDFKNMLRMSGDQFDYLLEHISQNITKSDTNMRQASFIVLQFNYTCSRWLRHSTNTKQTHQKTARNKQNASQECKNASC